MSNFGILPATQTIGSLDPHVLQIELPTYSGGAVQAAAAGDREIKPLQVLAHEMRHWFDIVGTVWGQSYLTRLFTAFDDALADDHGFSAYPSALAMFDADRAVLFPAYYKYVAPTAVAARGPGTWQIEMTTGVKIDAQGYSDEDQPIFFARFATMAGEIGRQPLTVGALLELRALQAEMLVFQQARAGKGREEQLVADTLYKNELLATLYDPELITYSAAAHLLAFAIGGADILGVLILGSQYADIALNMTPELFGRLRVPDEIAACGERRMRAFITNQDRGYAFAAMSFWNRQMMIDKAQGGFTELLQRSGFADFDTVYGAAEEAIRDLRADGLRNPRLKAIRKRLLAAGRAVIAFRRTRNNFFDTSDWPDLPTPPVMDCDLNTFWMGQRALELEDVEFLYDCDTRLKSHTRQALRAARGFDFSFTDYVY